MITKPSIGAMLEVSQGVQRAGGWPPDHGGDDRAEFKSKRKHWLDQEGEEEHF